MSYNIVSEEVLLVGAGPMAVEYAHILNDSELIYKTVGRGEASAAEFQEKTGHEVIQGGLDAYLDSEAAIPQIAIITLQVHQLADASIKLMRRGVKRILVEKPAGISRQEIEEVVKVSKETDSKVFVAYNRRFLASVQKAKELIKEDGELTSFNFEFTEWSHVIEPLVKPEGVKEAWFYANSTHVVDLAFFFGGPVKDISSYVQGGVSWHPKGSIFSGSGITQSNALFSYKANWESAGRWGVELLTPKRKFILMPMEKLHAQDLGTIKQYEIACDYTLDDKYKPGLYLQVYHFLMNDSCEDLMSIEEQLISFQSIYQTILQDQH